MQVIKISPENKDKIVGFSTVGEKEFEIMSAYADLAYFVKHDYDAGVFLPWETWPAEAIANIYEFDAEAAETDYTPVLVKEGMQQ